MIDLSSYDLRRRRCKVFKSLSKLPNLKVLMMTGYSGVIANLNAQNLKVVSKPFNIAEAAEYLKDEN